MRAICFAFRSMIALFILALLGPALASAQAKPQWQVEWEETLAAEQREGQVTVYGPPSRQHQDAIGAFQDAHPKIKLVYVPGSGTDNAQRLITERRAGKYLGDLFIGGSGTMIITLFRGNLLDPLPPLLLLPENRDESLWFSGRHLYADPKGQHVFMMQGQVQASVGAYNTGLVNPNEIKSHWDVLNPKWKGKMAAYDPRARGHIQNMRALYYNPLLGGEFIRRLFTEMDVTIGRDQRLLLDWVASGKFHIYLFATTNDVDDAARKGLPVGVLETKPDEGYMSGQFGHLALINKAPHPNAAKVFVNWILSKEGQLHWQRKVNSSSLRIDIPKDMLTDKKSVPQKGGKYLNASLPEYEDVTPVLKIVEDALAKAGKK